MVVQSSKEDDVMFKNLSVEIFVVATMILILSIIGVGITFNWFLSSNKYVHNFMRYYSSKSEEEVQRIENELDLQNRWTIPNRSSVGMYRLHEQMEVMREMEKGRDSRQSEKKVKMEQENLASIVHVLSMYNGVSRTSETPNRIVRIEKGELANRISILRSVVVKSQEELRVNQKPIPKPIQKTSNENTEKMKKKENGKKESGS